MDVLTSLMQRLSVDRATSNLDHELVASALSQLLLLLRHQVKLNDKLDNWMFRNGWVAHKSPGLDPPQLRLYKNAVRTVTCERAELNRSIDKYIEACTRQQSCEFQAAFYKQFPRELRDMAYRYVVGYHTVNVRDQDVPRTVDTADNVNPCDTTPPTLKLHEWVCVAIGLTTGGILSQRQAIANLAQEFDEIFHSAALHQFVELEHVPQYLNCRIAHQRKLMSHQLNSKMLI
ncbi:hypothetical protein CC86DRAFT_407356 [Ophiobolus disseminans]|uniref:Uncharacterized protein n=1 Tax=Ophiobolus disseminans TaxID=1469910 RepID=A0A6A6ZVP9_9PLEO|nr:hypothetical protein CC86DRAFT_407356 [Ophiobolus disseminans]